MVSHASYKYLWRIKISDRCAYSTKLFSSHFTCLIIWLCIQDKKLRKTIKRDFSYISFCVVCSSQSSKLIIHVNVNIKMIAFISDLHFMSNLVQKIAIGLLVLGMCVHTSVKGYTTLCLLMFTTECLMPTTRIIYTTLPSYNICCSHCMLNRVSLFSVTRLYTVLSCFSIYTL